MTALHLAVSKEDFEMVTFLLSLEQYQNNINKYSVLKSNKSFLK